MSQIDQKKSYWRSFGQLVKSKTYNLFLHKEFQEGASELTDNSRRRFIKLMGASAALAGVSGCGLRRPVQKIYPYVNMPEHLIPGKANFYATTLNLGRSVSGVLVESHQGRPTKIEGNPLHNENMGALTAFSQAEILNLYDPDRLKVSRDKSGAVSLENRDERLSSIMSSANSNGSNIGVLMQEQVSPSFYSAISYLKTKYSGIKFYKYESVTDDNQRFGLKKETGKNVDPIYRLDKADVLLSFGSDFLGNDQQKLRHDKDFASRRDPKQGLNRLYVFESAYSITGAKADHRFRIKSSDTLAVLVQLAKKLIDKSGNSLNSITRTSILNNSVDISHIISDEVLNLIVKDLLKNSRKSVLLAGAAQSEDVHRLVYLINSFILKTRAVSYVVNDYGNYSINRKSSVDQAKALVDDLNKSKIDTLFVLGGNPRFDFPSDLNMGPVLQKAKNLIVVSGSDNETTEIATLVIPRSHILESWGDARSISGQYSLVQPLINPMYESVSDLELVLKLAGYKGSAYRFVRSYWRRQLSGSFDASWKKSLHNGVIEFDNTTSFKPEMQLTLTKFSNANVSNKNEIEVNFVQDYSMYDGRFANNGWMQELPDPITKLTWDNAAYISPKTAKSLDLPALKGVSDIETVFQNPLPVASIKVGYKTLDLPLFVVPGHADNSITVPLGYGRKVVGRVGENTGFNSFYIRTSENPWNDVIKSIKISSKTYELASTQEHGSLEGRPLYAEATEAYYKEHPEFAKEMEHFPPMESLWEEHKYDKGYQWGMAIDLSKCTGCNACVVACQAENNIPIVGKDEVLNGREMHWIRLDRYFEGEKGEENPKMVHQPVTCLQCENAPCEQVCPVAATTHSEDGLNQMTYNRCIGTRYCSNNCPVKVRRFNFFDYHQRNPQAVKKKKEHLFDYFKEPDKTVKMQHNPNVTVRMRGVMEKCTYCVQRIANTKVQSKLENRSIRDGEIKTACQQTCAADAIVFGNINDPKSRVSKLKEQQRDYHLLKGLHLKARTSYLAAITNPNEKINKLLGYTVKQEVH